MGAGCRLRFGGCALRAMGPHVSARRLVPLRSDAHQKRCAMPERARHPYPLSRRNSMRIRLVPIRWLARPYMAAATTLALAASTVAAVLTGPTAQAASGLANVVVVTSPPSAPNSASPQVATATCPKFYTVIGAGGDISGGAGKVALEQVQPNLKTRSVKVTAAETDPIPLSWSVRAKAICAPAPGGLVEKVWHSAS